jgi:iron complex outermembrane receptor protein
MVVGTRPPRPRRGSVSLAVYWARVPGALIRFSVPGAPGRQYFRNAGSAVHRGVEAGLALAPFRGATLKASYTYTDARFDEYTVNTVSYHDKRVPGVAPQRGEAILGYEWKGLVAEVEERYESGVPVADANVPGTATPPFALTNLRLSAPRARFAGVALSPFVGLTNVFDREYVGSVTVNAFGGRYYEPGPRQTVYAGLELAAPGR